MNKARVNFSVVLNNTFVVSENAFYWFNKNCFFEPDKMMGSKLSNNKNIKFNEKKFFSGIEAEFKNDAKFKMCLLGGNNSFFFRKGQNNSSIFGNLEYELFTSHKKELFEFIEDIMVNYGGIVAVCSSLEDSFWQNNTDIKYYELIKGTRENLKIISDPRFNGVQIIDIEQNPGHSHHVNHIWFGSCWTMWFGIEYYQYVPKEVFLSYNSCYKNQQLDGDVVKIVLYENILEYELPENREKQWDFRKFTGIDNIAHHLLKIPISSNNPQILIESGKFDHGGVKKLTYFYNAEGTIVSNSHAIFNRIFELNVDGKLLWFEEKHIM